MKRASRKSSSHNQTNPSPEQIRGYMQALVEEHQAAWQEELLGAAPRWNCLLALHLRMIELEHVNAAAQEML